VTLLTDLLLGVVTGVALKIALHWFRGVPLFQLFRLPITTEEKDKEVILHLRDGSALFTNYLFLLATIQKGLASQKKVVLDISQARLIDHTTLTHLKQLSEAHDLEISGLSELMPVSNHSLSTHHKL